MGGGPPHEGDGLAGRRKGSPPLHAASMTVLERALTGRPSAASDAAPREEGGGGLPGKGRAHTTGGAHALPASKSLLSCSWGGGQPREPVPAAPVVKVRRLAVWHARRPRAMQRQSARGGGGGGRTTGAYRAPAQCSLRNGRWGGGGGARGGGTFQRWMAGRRGVHRGRPRPVCHGGNGGDREGRQPPFPRPSPPRRCLFPPRRSARRARWCVPAVPARRPRATPGGPPQWQRHPVASSRPRSLPSRL